MSERPSAVRFCGELTVVKSAGPARLVALDGLRFLAVLMVVAYHYVAYGSD